MQVVRAPDHPQEDKRLEALQELALLDSRSSPQWDRIAELASIICQTPIALVSLIDADRQWFKARRGLEPQETDRELAFCGWAILGDELFEVPDAAEDQRFSSNSLVTGPPHIRAYAGMPIKAPNGSPIGTVCAIDRKPMRLQPWQKEAMAVLAQMAEDLAHQRLVRRRLQDLVEEAPSAKQAINDVSHELGTPLTPIIVELAKLRHAGVAPTSIDRIQRNVDRLRDVVQEAVRSMDQDAPRAQQ